MADYNINAVTRRAVFTGSAGLGPYAFTFEVLDENDIAVYFNATKLTITTDYTVSVNANGTGDVTIVTGGSVPSTPTASDTITVIGARDIERTTDFVTAGDLLASSLNEQLDALTIFDQQLAEEGTRSMRAPVFDPAFVADGGTLDMTLPPKADRVDAVLAFDTDGNPVKGPTVAGITTITALAADITTLADIEDGTVATDAISDTAAIASDVSTVAGISGNVTTVAGISSDVTAVAADATDIGTVATNITHVNTVATNIADVITVANDLNEAISEIETAADDLNEAVSEIDTVAQNIANVNKVGAIDTDVTTVAGIDSNVTTVAGISANVTTVAGISANVTTVAGVSANVTTVAGISSDVTTVAGISSNITTVAGDSADIATVAGISSDVSTVATNNANVTTVASNIAGVNSFAERYRVGASDPTTSLDEGDLAYNSTDNALKYYNGTSWASITAGITDVVNDTTPQLGGNLDLNGNNITGSGDIPAANLTGTLPAIDGSALTGIDAFPSGTKMLFQQTAAPTGWTKDTTHNDKALRIVSGTVGTGGTTAFSTALGTPSVSGSVSISGAPDAGTLAVSISGSIGSTTLSVAQIPSHTHRVSGASASPANGAFYGSFGSGQYSGATGGGGSHNHSHSLSGSMTGAPGVGTLAGSLSSSTASINVQYVDVIIASKD